MHSQAMRYNPAPVLYRNTGVTAIASSCSGITIPLYSGRGHHRTSEKAGPAAICSCNCAICSQGFLLRRILLFGKLVNCIHHIVIVVSAYLTTDPFHAPVIVSFQQLYYKQDKSSDQARIVYSVLFFGAWPVFPENYIKCPVQVVFYIFQCLRATIENSSALGLMLHRKYRS